VAGSGLATGSDQPEKGDIMKSSTTAKTFTFAAVTALALCTAPMAKAQSAQRGCSNASLNGTYAYTGSGTIVSPAAIAGPFAEVGMQTFDGQGHTSATATASQGGNIIQFTITGTYTVNPDCTGTLTLQVAPIGITVPVFIVIDNGWNEFQAIETSAGVVITRVGHKLYPGLTI
jgi:hypothetical protein